MIVCDIWSAVAFIATSNSNQPTQEHRHCYIYGNVPSYYGSEERIRLKAERSNHTTDYFTNISLPYFNYSRCDARDAAGSCTCTVPVRGSRDDTTHAKEMLAELLKWRGERSSARLLERFAPSLLVTHFCPLPRPFFLPSEACNVSIHIALISSYSLVQVTLYIWFYSLILTRSLPSESENMSHVMLC